MKLMDLVKRIRPPKPWDEGDNIPWNEPGFSGRMLAEHLSQEHDWASRRGEIIDEHVDWIHTDWLKETPTRILDLGCGPGLYSSRLCKLGHECVGIDYSPASIEYAQKAAKTEDLACTYKCEDIRATEYGQGYGLAMMVYGEFNVFRPEKIELILKKMFSALAENGILLLEPHTYDAVKKIGTTGPSWFTAESGLFSDQPHVCLSENFWNEDTKTAIRRWYICDSITDAIIRYSATYQAYTDAEYRALLEKANFHSIQFYPSLSTSTPESTNSLMAITALK